MDKLVNLLPRPVFLGLVVVLGITFVFWRLETRPDALPAWGFLLNPLYIALVLIAVLAIPAYYLVSYLNRRLRPTKPGRVGMWLAEIEGDADGGYLRYLKGQVEQELSKDPALKNVEVRILSRVLGNHDEARKTGERLNAGAVAWGDVGKSLNERGVSNLKLTVIGGPMNLQNDVQFRPEVDFAGYEMRDVARFVAGYGLLSSGRPLKAAVHFDRILEDPCPGLFELSDALQFGGIACSLATRETTDSRDLLEKAERYFTQYKDLWSENRDPKPRAMGFFNLGGVCARMPGTYADNIEEALGHYGEATRLFLKSGDDEGYAMTRLEEAHILSDLYQAHNQAAYGTRAHLTLEDAAHYLDKEDQPALYAKLMFERGRLFNRMAHAFAFYYKSAVEAFEEALEVYLAIGYPVETALTLHHLGSARANVEDIGDEERQEVLTLYRQALSIATKARFPGIYANIQSSVCAVLLDCAATVPNLSAAVRAAEEALSAQGPQENPAEFARACINHAEAYLAYASLEEASEDKALHYLEGALSSAEAALGVVGPGFYPNFHGRSDKLANEARKKLEERGQGAGNRGGEEPRLPTTGG